MDLQIIYVFGVVLKTIFTSISNLIFVFAIFAHIIQDPKPPVKL